LLSQQIIDNSISLGERLKHIEPNVYNIFSCGFDSGFGSSATRIVLTEFIKEEDKIRVLYAEQFKDHPDPQMIVDKIFEFHKKYFNLWVNIDGSARGFITSLKIAFGENSNYEKAEDVLPGNNKILPVSFNKDHKQMISHLASLFNDGYVGIPEQFDKHNCTQKCCRF
jgi:hypothetical protein